MAAGVLLLALAALLGLSAGLPLRAADPAPPAIAFTTVEVGLVGMPPFVKELEKLQAEDGRGYNQARYRDWKRSEAGAWSTVATAAGRQGYVVALRTDGDGTVTQLACVATRQYQFYDAWKWPSPSPELAYLLAQPAPAASAPTRPKVAITLRPWAVEPTPGDTGGIGGDLKLQGSTRAVSAVTEAQWITALEPLLWAAAWESGLAPAAGQQAWTLTVDVAGGDRGIGLQVTLRGPGAASESSHSMEFVPEAFGREALARLVRAAKINVDARAAGADFDPILSVAHPLAALGPETDEAPLPRGPLSVMGTLGEGDAAGIVLHWPDGVRLFATSNGALDEARSLALARGQEALPALVGQALVPAAAATVAFNPRKQMLTWTQATPPVEQALNAPLTIGPLAAPGDDTVWFGLRDGTVQAVDPATGTPRWTRQLEGEISGPLELDAPTETLYVGTAYPDRLVALATKDGAIRWAMDLDDRLLRAPIPSTRAATGKVDRDRIVIATKSNHLMLVDPGDGTVIASRQWPTWIVDLRQVPDVPATPTSSGMPETLVLTDLAGTVTFLKANDLADFLAVPLGYGITSIGFGRTPVPWPSPHSVLRPEAGGGGLSADAIDLGAVLQEGVRGNSVRDVALFGDAGGFLWITHPAGKGGTK